MVVDSEQKTVTTYTALRTPVRIEAPAILDGGDVLFGLAIPLEAIFLR